MLTTTTILAVVAALSPVTATASPATPSFTLAIYGDTPYGTTPTDDAQFLAMPAFIDSINADPKVSLVAHVGDLHSGKQYCTRAYDESIATLFQRYADPLIYTPGDNEWTDCHKAAEGGGTYNPTIQQVDHVLDPVTQQPVDYAGGDPVANLGLVRSLFFNRPGHTVGGGHMLVLSQKIAYDRRYPSDAQYAENVIWLNQGILFVTLNIPGGSNNDTDPWYGAPAMSAAQAQESSERTGADLRWLDTAFRVAGLLRTRGVVVMEQADMWDLDGKPASHVAGYEPFVASLAAHTTAYGRPVLLFNGDSHIYRSDNPYSASAPCVIESGTAEVPCESAAPVHPGYTVANLHRITVHGSTFPLEWLRLTITPLRDQSGPNTFGPFGWSRVHPA